MSARTAATQASGGGRVALTAVAVVVAAVLMLLIVRAEPDVEPFDPRSGAASGTRGLVLLLESQGATVTVTRTVPASAAERVLVVQDRLDDRQRADLVAFATSGGVVVVADPQSTLAPVGSTIEVTGGEPSGIADAQEEANVVPGTCRIPALQRLRGVLVAEGVKLPVAGARGCFGDAAHAFVVASGRGEGVVVALGDNELFTNRYLRYADNAGLATALLVPAQGARVSILVGREAAKSAADIGTGDDTLADLVRPGVWMALVQLALAFVVFASARAVRTGRPVREPEQVPIAGSELVVATGRLMQRAHHAQRAGWLLRGDLYRTLCRRFRVPPTTSIEALDAIVSGRSALPAGTVAAVLQRDVNDDAALLRLGNSIEEIRAATLEGANR